MLRKFNEIAIIVHCGFCINGYKICQIVPVAVIKPVDYGRMNGTAVLKMAEKLVVKKTVDMKLLWQSISKIRP